MSFKTKAQTIINQLFMDFVNKVSEKYQIPKDKLIKIYNGEDSELSIEEDDVKVESPKVKKASSTSAPSTNKKEAQGESLDALKKQAKELGIQGVSKYKSSDKETLIKLIQEKKEKGSSQTTLTTKKVKEVSSKEELIQKIEERRTNIQIKKNKFGNYEHEGTKLVFDRNTKKVIGVQQDDGKILPLTAHDIQKCDELEFNYDLPNNLTSLKKKDELYDDDDEDDDDDDDEDDDIEDEEDE